LRAELESQLGEVVSWKRFLEERVRLDLDRHIDAATRERLDALPAAIRLLGDATALEYDVEGGVGIVRLRLREGQARRLDADGLPVFDRPVRFAVVRGGEPPLVAGSLEELKAVLRKPSGKAHPHRHRSTRSRIPRPSRRRR
jgi:hypothetical protein